MKHSFCSSVVAVIALSFGSIAANAATAERSASPASIKSSNAKAAKGSTTTAAPGQGAHSGTKFSITRFRPGQLASDMLDHSVALVVTADSSMQGGKQVVNVSVSCHLDGPNGRLEAIDKIGYRITQPVSAQSKPNPKATAQVQGSHTIPGGGGYKTVVVEAFLSDSKVADTKVTLTVPGDK
ncbi:MAG: hypothetical protein H0T11_03070 [Chthoniobacterales bacterium]|nr:hypothetical protein [Chthoniobacterales bacterium]